MTPILLAVLSAPLFALSIASLSASRESYRAAYVARRLAVVVR